MSSFIESMINQARSNRQRIVLPEGDDVRTLKAAEHIIEQGIAEVTIIGTAETIYHSECQLEGATIIDASNPPQEKEYAELLFELRRAKGLTREEAFELIHNPLYLGAVMVKAGDADGMVCGACHSTSDVLRAALQIVRTAPGTRMVSSFFIMAVPECSYGDEGVFLFTDAGLCIQPSAEELAVIATTSAHTWKSLFSTEPRVALLSHSTMGSTVANPDRDKVIEATRLAHEMDPDILLDGEMQADAALVPSVGSSKAPESPVAGRANILVFPDLDAANIGYKLVQRLAHAEAYGPITQGLAAPINDLSRGASVEDIVGVVAITAVQCQALSAEK